MTTCSVGLRGPLLDTAGRLPLSFFALLCDLRPRFLAKCQVRTGFRAVARNGRVLLASERPLEELMGRVAGVRMQTWHKVILAGEAPEPWGVLLCIRCGENGSARPYTARLTDHCEEGFALALDVGGGMELEFR
jgi:hypothetical protein